MIVMQIRGVGDSLRFRLSEWLLAGVMLAWGSMLLLPDPLFVQLPSMAGMASIAPEGVWGLACFAIGAARLIILIVNGSWRRVHKARALCAFLCALVWASIAVGLFRGGFLTPGVVTYPLFVLADLFTVWRAAADARIQDEAAKREAAKDGRA